MMINKKGMLHAVAALCFLALVTSCRKEEEKSTGAVMENREPTQRERYEAEIKRIVVGSNMTAFATGVAANRICNEIDKAVDAQEAIWLFDKMCDLALKQPIDAPASYNLHSSINWRLNHLHQLWRVTLDGFCFAQSHRQDSFDDWNRLFMFFRRYTDEIKVSERRISAFGNVYTTIREEEEYYLGVLKGDLGRAVHVMRKFYFPRLAGGLSEEQKADILRRFDEVEKYAELPPDAPGKKMQPGYKHAPPLPPKPDEQKQVPTRPEDSDESDV